MVSSGVHLSHHCCRTLRAVQHAGDRRQHDEHWPHWSPSPRRAQAHSAHVTRGRMSDLFFFFFFKTVLAVNQLDLSLKNLHHARVFFNRCGLRRQEEAAAADALKFLCRWRKLKVKCSSWSSCASCAPFLKVAAAGWESDEGKLSSAACNYKRSTLFAQRLCVNVTDGRDFSLNCFRVVERAWWPEEEEEEVSRSFTGGEEVVPKGKSI